LENFPSELCRYHRERLEESSLAPVARERQRCSYRRLGNEEIEDCAFLRRMEKTLASFAANGFMTRSFEGLK